MGQNKDGLIKQKQRLCAEEKENKIFIPYFSSAGDVQPTFQGAGFRKQTS